MSGGASGLAAAIRGATESETFDLAGQNVTTITTNIRDAFADPLPLEEMIRITFVTGAGKLARQKYDDGAAKAVTSALRELGFEEDRGASAVLECAASFKQQHDTGKNLKTVVVFPRVVGASLTSSSQQQQPHHNGAANNKTSVIPESSPEHSIAFSSMNVFERMVSSKCQTWTQKKGCSNAIGTIKTKLEELEQKLMSGTPLTDPEQSFYDSVSMSSLDEKQNFVKELMHKQVEIDGKITAPELKSLQEQVNERLANLSTEKAQAEKDGKAKRVQNLSSMITKAEERKAKLEKITVKTPPPLKHEPEISKLRQELAPLLEVEDASKGRLLSLKETQALGRKEEILEQIEQLEVSSRGWFEDDETFEARVQASKSAWIAKMKQQSKKKKPAAASSSSTGSAWATAASRKKPSTGGSKKPSAAKSKAGGGGGVFAAMMMDSDSD